ncbi:MAG: homocysteine S-methyltransferase [Akkermansiaceae bacterium]
MKKMISESFLRPLVLDGGLSNVLEEMGCPLDPLLWTAGLLASHPRKLVRAHRQYLRAGADVITTAGYQASLPGFLRAGRSSQEGRALLVKAVEIAREARSRFYEEEGGHERPRFIAAGMGPYGAYLADGSEYTGIYHVGNGSLKEFHQPRLELLAATDADLLLFETMPSLRELEVVGGLLDTVEGSPVMVSLCCQDDSHLRDGESVSEALAILRELRAVVAVGVNCLAPEHVTGLIALMRAEAPEKKIAVYPNSGEVYQAKTKSWLGLSNPVNFGTMAREWIEAGAGLVGGCCRIGPTHIGAIRRAVDGLDTTHPG